jgi:hypothetical protein
MFFFRSWLEVARDVWWLGIKSIFVKQFEMIYSWSHGLPTFVRGPIHHFSLEFLQKLWSQSSSQTILNMSSLAYLQIRNIDTSDCVCLSENLFANLQIRNIDTSDCVCLSENLFSTPDVVPSLKRMIKQSTQ